MSQKKVRKNFCQDSTRYKTARVAGEFIGILARLSRSFLFNIFAFAAGFGCCFIVVDVNWQHERSKVSETKIVEEVEKKLGEMKAIDAELHHKQDEAREALEKLKDNITGNSFTNILSH